MKSIVLLSLLGLCGLEDLRRKEIHIGIIIFMAVLGFIFQVISQEESWLSVICGMIVGVGMFLVSVFSKEKVGKADALLIGVIGIFLGFWKGFLILWIASLLAGIGGLFLFIVRKQNKEYRMPFVPFLFLADGIVLILEKWGGI